MYMIYHKPSKGYVRMGSYSSGAVVDDPAKGTTYTRLIDAQQTIREGRFLSKRKDHAPTSEFEVHQVEITVKRIK